MSLYYKTPVARKAAWGCFRRCLAVMLCCVLVFSLTVRVTPGAKATAAVGSVAQAVAASGAVPLDDLLGASVGLLVLIALGVDVDSKLQGNLETKIEVADRMGYKWGWQVDAYLRGDDVDEATRTEWDSIVERFSSNEVAAGDSFSMSSTLAATVRSWVNSNLDFIDGVVQYNNYVLPGVHGDFVLTNVNWTKRPSSGESYGSVISLGSTVFGLSLPNDLDMSQAYNHRVNIVDDDFVVQISWTPTGDGISHFSGTFDCRLVFHSGWVTLGSGSVNRTSSWEDVRQSINSSIFTYSHGAAGALAYVPEDNIYYVGSYIAQDGEFWSPRTGQVKTIPIDLSPGVVTTSLTKTPSLDAPVEKAVTVTLPSDLAFADVGGISVPDIGTLTGEELTGEKAGEDTPAKNPGITAGEISQAITDALPITGAIASDQAVNEVAQDPDGLGAVFISKFPFCIPWDVGKFISLLAAQPVTPHWEVNFYSPLEGVGGFHAQGDTTFVFDFEQLSLVGQLCRWTSYLGFIYALMLGSKSLIWTA